MPTILQHAVVESTLKSNKFYPLAVILRYAVALNGFLLHKYFRHGALLMNILRILRARIIEAFPEITAEELLDRIEYAHALIKNVK